jgi:ribonuclease P protein component
MGLPTALRLARAAEFARVRAEGGSFPGRYLVLSVLKADDITGWKCGLITTKKLGNAVTRNLVRRRLREVVRADFSRLQSGRWFVIIARWRAPQASFEELKKDWQAAALRAGLLDSLAP